MLRAGSCRYRGPIAFGSSGCTLYDSIYIFLGYRDTALVTTLGAQIDHRIPVVKVYYGTEQTVRKSYIHTRPEALFKLLRLCSFLFSVLHDPYQHHSDYDYITDPCHFSPSRRLFFYTVKCVLCHLYYRTALIRAEISLYAVRAYLYHSAKHAVHRPDLHSRLEALQSAFMSVSIFFLFIHQHDEHYYTKDNCYY